MTGRSLCILNSKLTREHRNRNHLIFIVYFLRLMYPQAGSELKKKSKHATRATTVATIFDAFYHRACGKLKATVESISVVFVVYNSFYTLKTLRDCNVLKWKIELMSHLKPNAVYFKSYQLHLLNS